MKSVERKARTEKYLKRLGIPYIDHLPPIEEEEHTTIRTAEAFAKRVLILTYLNYVAEEEDDKPMIIEFLKKEKLWKHVSPREKQLFETNQAFDHQDQIIISWQAECIWLLLWCLGKFDNLKLPVEQVAIRDILKFLPGFLDPTEDFIKKATVRSKSEIMDQSDFLYRLHWAVRHDMEGKKPRVKIERSIVVERHYAINWATCLDEWDDVTLDT